MGNPETGNLGPTSHAYVLAAALSISICVLLLIIIAYTLCQTSNGSHRRDTKSLPDDNDDDQHRGDRTVVDGCDEDYMYSPGQGGILDEEYTNTFVGVSIPLLQDVSKV